MSSENTLSKRIVTIELTIDPVDYGQPDSNEAAMDIASAILRGDADLVDTYTIERSRPAA